MNMSSSFSMTLFSPAKWRVPESSRPPHSRLIQWIKLMWKAINFLKNLSMLSQTRMNSSLRQSLPVHSYKIRVRVGIGATKLSSHDLVGLAVPSSRVMNMVGKQLTFSLRTSLNCKLKLMRSSKDSKLQLIAPRLSLSPCRMLMWRILTKNLL